MMNVVVLGTSLLCTVLAVDPLAAWRQAKIAPVLKEAPCHAIHTYYVTCPESPDGRFVLLYTSTDPRSYVGEVRLVERASGTQRVLARNVTVEDAHRAACQQWIGRGQWVAFHDLRDGHWLVACVDVATGRERVLARDRQLGFGRPTGDAVPVYSPHFNPGTHCDLELVDVRTGQTRTAVTAAQVTAAYPDWIKQRFGQRPVSIFFPVLSPNGQRVMFKMSTPGDGNFRSGKASTRSGLIVYDLQAERFLGLRRWGHPSWSPDSQDVFDLGAGGVALVDPESGCTRASARVPDLGAGHPSLAPDGRLFVTDRAVRGAADPHEVLVGDLQTGQWVVVHRFENGRGAASWRRSDPHPVFSADGRRIYFNTSAGRFTSLVVAERAP
jgi:Tol biopolymer transport system component